METNVTSQEILIVHESRFFSKEFNEREEPDEGKRLSPNEQIAEACWNGLIREILPEISTPLSLMAVDKTRAFLYLLFGEYEQKTEKESSLNPCLFLNALPCWN